MLDMVLLLCLITPSVKPCGFASSPKGTPFVAAVNFPVSPEGSPMGELLSAAKLKGYSNSFSLIIYKNRADFCDRVAKTFWAAGTVQAPGRVLYCCHVEITATGGFCFMSKQRLLFITTGGTIASVRTQQGLKPVLTSEELLAHLPELKELCCPETLALCSIDSTDLGQEHWLMMARAIQENYAL